MASDPSNPELFEAACQSISAHDSFEDILSALVHSGHCARPVRLVGDQVAVHLETGEARTVFSSNDASDGVVLKACGSRRASVCPACAATYKADARHLVIAGLAGGKGVDPSIATHPAVFATLTAPSFGAVHQAKADGGCHAPATKPHCAHRRSVTCGIRHERSDPAVG